MSWPSLSQIADAGIDRRQVLRSSATALAMFGTATPSAGRSNTAPTPTEAVEDRLAPSTAELTQQQKLTPDDGDKDEVFGARVAVSSDGTTALIGAFNDDSYGSAAGSAYIFTRTDGTWTQQQKLVADDGDGDDRFGLSVALSSDGTTALIGAFSDENPNGEQAGSAYIFTRTDSTWTQQQKLVADDGDSEDWFGRSMALSNDGTTALIGAMGYEGPTGEQVGSAYVFTHTDGEWGQQKLMADDGDAEDLFGGSVALSGNGTTALIGAYNDKNSNGEAHGQFSGAGSAYVFTYTNDEWSQQQKLTADDSDSEDWFGYSV